MKTNVKLELAGAVLAILGAGALFAFNDSPRLIEKLANYPNPFDSRREETFITYTIPQSASVRVKIYDLFGFAVREFSFGPGEEGGRAGQNSVRWDGTDQSGQKVSKGGYICHVIVEGDQPVRGVRKIGVIH